MIKQCFKCGTEKPLEDFYKHPQMKDGRVNKCKECNKSDVRENRAANIDYYREYDKGRGARRSAEDVKEYRKNHPNKYKATSMVNNAIRGKKLHPMPCEVCGRDEDVHAHHDDYLKPLNVRWLCPPHHFEWHKENGPGLNG